MRQIIRRRLRRLAHWRCAEPVLVIESDDWGLQRRASRERLRCFGEPGEWADETAETDGDLRRLFDVLDRHRDATGRPAAFSGNVVVTNPDHDAIARDRYDVLSRNSDQHARRPPCCVAEGVERRVFFAELHGRRHFSVEAWLADLRRDVPGARELSSEYRHGGLSLLEGQNWRYHTEYVSWRTGVEPDEIRLSPSLTDSLDILEGMFGRRPTSTIAPHYIFSSRIEKAWREAGFRFVQGANYQILRSEDGGHGTVSVSHSLGERSPSGLLYLHRFVRFEPRPERPHQDVAAALAQVFVSALNKDSGSDRLAPDQFHRVVSRRRATRVGRITRRLEAAPGPYFLTTAELGEAIESERRPGHARLERREHSRLLIRAGAVVFALCGRWNARRVALTG